VVRGSWFVVRGSWFVVRGSWFVVRGSWAENCLWANACLPSSYDWRRTTSHEPRFTGFSFH